MKQVLQKLLSLRLLLVTALMVSAFSGAWAETSTLTFKAKCNGSGTADDNVAWTVTSDGTESTFDSTKGIHYGTNNASVQYVKLSTSGISGTITKVVVNASTASGVTATADVTVGGAAFGDAAQSLSTTATDYTFEGSASGDIVVTVTKSSSATKALYVKSIVVTYTTEGGDTPSLAESDFTLTGTTDLTFDLYTNADAQVINYATSSTGAVTVKDNDYVYVEVGERTLTVTPLKKTNGEVEITVNQAKDDSYKAGSATFTVTITDSTPKGDVTEDDIDFTGQNYSNQQEIKSFEADGSTITFDKGTNSNTPKYYTSGTAIRVYGGNTITVASTCDKNISEIKITFGSSDGSNEITVDAGSYSDGTWTGDAESVTFTIGGTSGNRRIAGITVTYADASDTRATTEVAIDATGITNTNVFTSTAAGKLTATVSVKDGDAIEGATVAWSGNNDAVATIAADGTVTLVAAGAVTFTATYYGDEENYKGSTDTYSLTVTNSDPNVNDGSAEKPYTVEEIIAFIETLNGGTSGKVHVKGIVSKVDAFNSNYNSITYWISTDGTTESAQFECYSGLGLNSTAFSSIDDVAVGDEVVVAGTAKKYNDIYEFNNNNYLVSTTHKELADAGLSFGETTSFEVNINEDFTAPTLTNPNNLTVSYSSSDENLALVDESTGEVVIGETAGTVTITATFAGNDDFKAGSASYTINIVDPNDVTTYVALVAQYEGKYYAVGTPASTEISAIEVDAVNGKVISEETDEISYLVEEYFTQGTTFKNKKTNTYIGYNEEGGTNTVVSTSQSGATWTAKKVNEVQSWTYINTNSSATERSLRMNNSFKFRTYAINQSGYSTPFAAYTFANGYTREVTSGAYGTICLPYDVAADDYAGVKFYKIASKKMSGETLKYINLEEVTELVGGAAYIYQANEDATKLIAAYSGSEETEPFDAGLSETGLTGTFEKAYIPQGNYMLKDGKLYLVDKDEYIYSGANKAYIDLTNVPEESASIKGIRLFNGDIETGISTLKAESQNGNVYNLAGQRVNATKAGIYVAGGKKVVVK